MDSGGEWLLSTGCRTGQSLRGRPWSALPWYRGEEDTEGARAVQERRLVAPASGTPLPQRYGVEAEDAGGGVVAAGAAAQVFRNEPVICPETAPT